MRAAAASVDKYLRSVPLPEHRAALERVRAIIRDELPDAQETISYGMPTFKLNGMIASYAAFKGHCSFFPGAIVDDFADRLGGFKTAKGTVQFTPEHPIPEALLRDMVRANVARNLAKKKKR